MCPGSSLIMDNTFKLAPAAKQVRTDSEKGKILKFHTQIPTG